jgi:hypothetical protein
MNIRSLLGMILCLTGSILHAQDTLVYTNGQRIVGQVEEIGLDLVRYRTNSSGNSVTIVVEKRDLARIQLQEGQQFLFGTVSTDVPRTEAFMSRKQQLAIDVLAPALDHITLSYERNVARRISITGSMGYIGLWERDYYNNSRLNSGGLMKAGVKFILPKPTRRFPHARAEHPLAGWFLKPELMFSSWTERNTYYYSPYPFPPYPPNNEANQVKTFYSSAALNLVIGTQILIGERISFGLHGGLGYGVMWRNGKTGNNRYGYYNSREYAFSHSFFEGSSPLCVSGGVQFGFVF